MPTNEGTYSRTWEQAGLPWVPTHRHRPFPLRPLPRGTLQSFIFPSQGHGRLIGRIALVVDGSRTGPRAHPAKYAWEGDVGPVDWGDAITTTSCRLTDKSRIGSGGLAGLAFCLSQACRH